MTAPELAKKLNVDPKALRRWLRKEHARPTKVKGTDWEITPKVAAAARKRFAKK